MSELTFNKSNSDDIAKHYAAAMDSVKLINGGKPAGMTDEIWSDCVNRNKQHLKIMLSKTWWTTEDLAPLQAAAQ